MHLFRLRSLPRALIIALCVIAGVITSVASVSAAPSIRTTVTSGRETIHLSNATCAKLKAAAPKYASDPRLCTMTHVWSETLSTQAAPAGVAPATGCPVGTAYFYDYDYSDLDLWEMDLNTGFDWGNNCWAPALIKQQCYVAFTISTSITEQKCWNYSTNVPSEAAVYQGLVTEDAILQFPTSQRRECYEAYNNCAWTQWDGW